MSAITFRVAVPETLKGSLSWEVTVRRGGEFFYVTSQKGEPA